MVCAVCEIFSSFSPAVSTRGAESLPEGVVCDGAPPRPCATAGATDNTSNNRKDVRRFVIIDFILIFLGAAAAGAHHVFLLDAIDVELLRAGDDLVEGLVEVERRRLRKPGEVHPRDDERFE